ncbi:MAG: patatin-like phospholipase family protein, partial [bacterium]
HLHLLHDIWIKEIDYKNLFSSSSEPSLFSQKYLKTLAEKYFNIRENHPFKHPPKCVVTATNLDGILFGTRSLHDNAWIIQKVYNDWFVIDSSSKWKDKPLLTSLALATSAFPLAFAPVEVRRESCDYKEIPGGFYHCACQRDLSLCFSYSDGGICDNKPIGLAMRYLPRLFSKKEDERDERFLILVEPDPAFPSSQTPEIEVKIQSYKKCRSENGQNIFQSNPVSLLAHLMQILISRNEDVAKDFLHAHKKLHHISLKQKLLNCIQMLLELIPDPVQMTPEQKRKWQDLNNRLRDLLETERAFSWKNRGMSEDRIQARLGDFHRRESKSPEQISLEQIFEEFDEILQIITETENLCEFHLFRIAPKDPKAELSSDFFGHFGGFFDEQFREYDFELGRHYASQFIKTHLFPDWCIAPKPSKSKDPEWKDLPWQKKVDIHKRFLSAVLGMISPGPLRWIGTLIFHLSFPFRARFLSLPRFISFPWYLLYLLLLIPLVMGCFILLFASIFFYKFKK